VDMRKNNKYIVY